MNATAKATKRRRDRGEGSVWPRKDEGGKVIGWCATVDLGWGEDGKQHKRWLRCKTKGEALAWLAKTKHQDKTGTLPETGKTTLGKWLQRWLEDVVKPSVRYSTIRMYTGIVNDHLIPVLGRKELTKLSVGDVRQMLNSRTGLSPRSRSHIRACLRRALNIAIKDGLIPSGRNVAALVEPPKVTHKPVQPWTPAQAKHFLACVKGDPLAPIYVLALTTGLRQGEILGLRWKDIELANGILHVVQAVQRQGKEYKVVHPKTDRGLRTVPLTKQGVDALVAHQDRPTAAVVSLAHLRNEKAFPDLVFRAANGEPLNGSYVHHRFQAAANDAGLPVCRFHDLRHACASLLASMGVPLLVVSQILGHSSVKLTGDTYTHLYAPALRDAALAMEAALA